MTIAFSFPQETHFGVTWTVWMRWWVGLGKITEQLGLFPTLEEGNASGFLQVTYQLLVKLFCFANFLCPQRFPKFQIMLQALFSKSCWPGWLRFNVPASLIEWYVLLFYPKVALHLTFTFFFENEPNNTKSQCSRSQPVIPSRCSSPSSSISLEVDGNVSKRSCCLMTFCHACTSSHTSFIRWLLVNLAVLMITGFTIKIFEKTLRCPI